MHLILMISCLLGKYFDIFIEVCFLDFRNLVEYCTEVNKE